MALVLNGSGITSANIADGTITTDDILASDVKNLKSGRKNLIINGGFDVWQRGTSFTGSATGYTADRWRSYTQTGKTITSYDNGLRYVLASSTVFSLLSHRLEVNNPKDFSEKTFTLTFNYENLAAVTFASGTDFYFEVNGVGISTGPLGSTSFETTVGTHTTSATFTMPVITTTDYVDIRIVTNNAATDVVFTNVQLELGSVATDFEHRSYGEELALCQRYYEIASGGSYGAFPTTSDYRVSVPYKVTKRAAPTITVLSSTENCASNATALGGHFDATLGGRVQGTNVFLPNSASKYFYAKFSADAEL